ncbi:molybdenum cofactor guanylyltransferase [soil metagenome]
MSFSHNVNSPFSAVLLAGGKSSRMGCDKAFVEIDGEPLWERQIRLLCGLEPHEIFIAGPERREWRSYNVIPDAEPHCGPVPVVASALRRCATPLLLVLAVDLPQMTADYLRGLVDRGAVVPRGQPLSAIYPREAESLADSCRSMQQFASCCAAEGLVRLAEVAPDDEHLFFNLNTPVDLAALTSAEASDKVLEGDAILPR